MNDYISTAPLYYDTYLAHHGIKGQKWGVRHYQNEDGSLTNAGRARYGISQHYANREKYHIGAIDSSRTRLGKNWHNRRAYVDERKKNRNLQKINDYRRFSDTLGAGAWARRSEAASNYYARKSDYSKTKLGKHLRSIYAYNSGSMSRATRKIRDSESIVNNVKARIERLVDTPVKSIAGRETQSGREILLSSISSGVIPMAMDIKYLYDKKKTNVQ